MSTFGDADSSPPGANPPLPGGPPNVDMPPDVDMMASPEMQAWLRRLQSEDHKIGTRNRVLAVALAAGMLLFAGVLWWVYDSTVGAYAVIDNVEIQQHPIDQGRLEIKFDVVSPGEVYCRRKSGQIETDLINHFSEPFSADRPWSWSWAYQPGEEIEVTLECRSGWFPKSYVARCPTADRADIVVLIDTTGSMDRSIDELRGKCAAFSEKLNEKALKHRFALIGFGDAGEFDVHGFTPDVIEFGLSVGNLRRYDGGDLAESALDALEEALLLPYDEKAIRRFYLVTDADYHEPTRSGATAEDMAARLKEQNVLLRVFSRQQHKEAYVKLLGETGRFQEIENFGRVLSQARMLED